MSIQCTNCEGILQPGDDFCTSCGCPRKEPGVPEVLAVFPQAQLSKGLLGFGSTMNVLVLTREHLLIAETSEALQEQIEEMDGELQEEVQKFFAQGGEDAHEFMKLHDFSQAPWQIYARRPLRDSQQENPHNRILELQAIRKVEAHMYDDWNDDTLRLFLAEETLQFRFMWPLGQFALETFQKVMGDKVKNLSF